MKYPIDRKERVVLGGLKQAIHIWGTKTENPVVLFLHGGPGVPNRHGMAKNHMDLTDDFTIVAWDQRGTGGSYFGCDPRTLTLEQLISDCAELVDYLCETLNKKQIFLLGGSWGTELGTLVCQKYPQKIAGYIGYGQVVNGIENENVSYAFALEKAKEAGCAEDIAQLERIGPPVDGQYRPVLEGLLKQRSIMKKYGGHSTKKGGYFSGTVIPILCSPELSIRDKIGTAKGYKVCLSAMWPTIVHYDFVKDCGPFQMPYYIFQGRKDNNTPSSLVQAFYDSIEAPDKDLIWFENSAHGPLGEEPETFKRLMREKFLAIHNGQMLHSAAESAGEEPWSITEEEYRTRQVYGPDDIDTLSEEEKTAYLEQYRVYASMLHTYFIRHFRLKEYDEALQESPFRFPPVKEADMDLYQYLAHDQLTFVYIRNNLYLRRLTSQQRAYLAAKAGEKRLRYDDAADAFVGQTWKNVILEDPDSTVMIQRGPDSGSFFAPMNSVTIGIRWDDYVQEPGQSPDDWYEWNNSRLQDMETLSIILETRMPKLTQVDVNAIHYNEFSVKKRTEDQKTEEDV